MIPEQSLILTVYYLPPERMSKSLCLADFLKIQLRKLLSPLETQFSVCRCSECLRYKLNWICVLIRIHISTFFCRKTLEALPSGPVGADPDTLKAAQCF